MARKKSGEKGLAGSLSNFGFAIGEGRSRRATATRGAATARGATAARDAPGTSNRRDPDTDGARSGGRGVDTDARGRDADGNGDRPRGPRRNLGGGDADAGVPRDPPGADEGEGGGVPPGPPGRCRKCGHAYATLEWQDYHVHNRIGTSESRFLRNVGEGNKVWDLCTVPENLYADGFPCLDGNMPRSKRVRRKR